VSEHETVTQKYTFPTRDLLIMAVLVALGGIASTYINALGDAVHAVLGFPGATQWVAGLHVVWIVLAIAITGKPGTGVITGALKGAVELMSGNTHGLIILLINLVAGLLVDFGFLIFRNKRSLFPYLIAGGLATGSNVLVFQLFATLPANILAATAIVILFFVALVSGLVFSGFVPFLLIKALSKAGIVKSAEPAVNSRRIGWYILAGVFVLAIILTVFLRIHLQSPQEITISGEVSQPYAFSTRTTSIETVTQQMEYKGVMTEYVGYPLIEVISEAGPSPDADLVLIEAVDGYAFLISFEELNTNENILLVYSGQGKNASFDLVGSVSSKAWVRNISWLAVIASKGLRIQYPAGEMLNFDPDEWVSDMDSTQVALPDGSQKLQGVPVWKVLDEALAGDIPTTIVFSNDTQTESLPWSDLADNDQIRIFTVIEEAGLSFALGDMSGKVLLFPLTQIDIQ